MAVRAAVLQGNNGAIGLAVEGDGFADHRPANWLVDAELTAPGGDLSKVSNDEHRRYPLAGLVIALNSDQITS